MNEEDKLVVLDLACGKGGDTFKWARESVQQYVGVDISKKSIDEAKTRLTRESEKGKYNCPSFNRLSLYYL